MAGERVGRGDGAGNRASRWASCCNAETAAAAGGDAGGDAESGDAVEMADARETVKTAAGDAVLRRAQGAHGSGSSRTHWGS